MEQHSCGQELSQSAVHPFTRISIYITTAVSTALQWRAISGPRVTYATILNTSLEAYVYLIFYTCLDTKCPSLLKQEFVVGLHFARYTYNMYVNVARHN